MIQFKNHFSAYCGIVARRSQSYMKLAFKEFGLTLSEALILLDVLEEPGQAQDEIADNMALDNAVTTRCLKNLEKQGLVTRIVDPNNQRIKRVNATKKAEALREKIDIAINCWEELLLENMPEQYQRQVANMLRQFYAASAEIDINEVLRRTRTRWDEDKARHIVFK